MTNKQSIAIANAALSMWRQDTFWDRFWARVLRNPSNDCWEWIGIRTRLGYGQAMRNRKTQSVHRIIFQEVFGPIPEGMKVCHRCDNPPCVNPFHLFLGTQRDNVLDAIRKGRRGPPPGRKRLSISEDQILEMRNLYDSGALSQDKLSVRFGISQSSVGKIVRKAHNLF